jgi:hypothetical protein
LIEIEEKRKKRRDRKEQQHFRGSSFGQGSTQRVAEIIKAYEYGPQGFSLEESQDSHVNNEFGIPGINFLKDKINVAIHESTEFHFQSKDLAETSDSYKGLIGCISKVSNEDLLEYVMELEHEKGEFQKVKNSMTLEYKKLRTEYSNIKNELEQMKDSYRELLSKFGSKEIQTRGYRLALSNSNELLYEVIHQIKASVSSNSIQVQNFINSMNIKIMKLLEQSTKELQTLTDINPQYCLLEISNDSKDPIEDAFAHLRSLLTFQTALKRSGNPSISSDQTQRTSNFGSISLSDLEKDDLEKVHQSRTSEENLIMSEHIHLMKESPRLSSSRYIFQKAPIQQNSYSKMHSLRSNSREQKKKPSNLKIYSQLLTTRNSQVRGRLVMIIFRSK